MLIGGRRPPKPGIIGDIEQEARASIDKLAGCVWENAFVADQDAKGMGWQGEDGRRAAGGKIANAFDHFIQKEQKAVLKRNIFAKRSEDHFFVQAKYLRLGRQAGRLG